MGEAREVVPPPLDLGAKLVVGQCCISRATKLYRRNGKDAAREVETAKKVRTEWTRRKMQESSGALC